METIQGHGKAVALRFEDVSFSYGSIPVLNHASFHLHRGEFAALVGPNGTGKTTILRLMLGLAEPDAGLVEVLGRSPGEARLDLGFVPQHADFDKAFPVSVEEVVRMGRLGLRGSNRRLDLHAMEEAMVKADVADLRKRSYTALSGGQRRRVLVARALASQPQFLVLDEPTANMDRTSEQRFFETLELLKGETTILMVTHDTEFVSSLTDVILCAGDRSGSILRHGASTVQGARLLRVIHEETLPDTARCDDCGHGRTP